MLLPAEEPALRFAARLVDEALDEVGLYLVHHNRWVVSARDNDAGPRLARQMRPLLGPAARVLAGRFPARQVRRLPYLFSVAPADAHAFADLPARLRPPTREGFPATHALLEQAFRRLLGAVEPVLTVLADDDADDRDMAERALRASPRATGCRLVPPTYSTRRTRPAPRAA